jgi:hypothetical protein
MVHKGWTLPPPIVVAAVLAAVFLEAIICMMVKVFRDR